MEDVIIELGYSPGAISFEDHSDDDWSLGKAGAVLRELIAVELNIMQFKEAANGNRVANFCQWFMGSIMTSPDQWVRLEYSRIDTVSQDNYSQNGETDRFITGTCSR